MKKGFTLIEILIVVAIIAILASVILVGLGPTQSAGRDARRVSDIQEIQNGLELYYNTCGDYPAGVVAGNCAKSGAGVETSWANLTSDLEAAGIGVTAVPNDPSAGASYVYGTNGATANGIPKEGEYIIGATLENGSSNVFNNYKRPSNYADFGAGDWTTSGNGAPGAACNSPEFCASL